MGYTSLFAGVLRDGEPDFHWLAQQFLLPGKIELVFSCQSRNLSAGASGNLRSRAQSA
jgi:hypothetical protein